MLSSKPAVGVPKGEDSSHKSNSLPQQTITTDFSSTTSEYALKPTKSGYTPLSRKPSKYKVSISVIPLPLKLIKERVKFGPARAIASNGAEHQKHPKPLRLPATSVLSERPNHPATSLGLSLTAQNKAPFKSIIRSKSLGSFRSISTGLPEIRESDIGERQPNFLGRYPAPFQQRSVSLPKILEHFSSLPSPKRKLLFIGGSTHRSRPGYTKVPRFVPLEIRLKPAVEMGYQSTEGLTCNHGDVNCEICERTGAFAPRDDAGLDFASFLEASFLNESSTGATRATSETSTSMANKINDKDSKKPTAERGDPEKAAAAAEASTTTSKKKDTPDFKGPSFVQKIKGWMTKKDGSDGGAGPVTKEK